MPETEVGSERHRFCPSCGTEAVLAGSFCRECGRSLIKTSAQTSDAATANQQEASGDVALTKKSRKWLWPVGVAAILLIAAGIIFGVPQIRHDVLGDGSATQASFGVPCSQNPACSGSLGNSGNTGSAAVNTNSLPYKTGYNEGKEWANLALDGLPFNSAVGPEHPTRHWCTSVVGVEGNRSETQAEQAGCLAGWALSQDEAWKPGEAVAPRGGTAPVSPRPGGGPQCWCGP